MHEKNPTSYVFSAVYLFQILCCYKNMIKTDKKSNNQRSSQEYSSSLNCSNTIRRFCDKNAKNILSDPASLLEGYNSRKKYVKITYTGTWKLRKRKRLHIFGVLYIFYGKNYLYARTCYSLYHLQCSSITISFFFSKSDLCPIYHRFSIQNDRHYQSQSYVIKSPP